MEINHWNGLIAVILAFISFYVIVYVVLALNVGWRFGYWVSSASFGGVMLLLSLFWVVTPVGPRGHDPVWIAVGASRQPVASVQVEGEPLQLPSGFPEGGDWEDPKEGDALFLQNDPLKSAMGNCVSADPENLEEREREACEAAQALMPTDEQIPKINGEPVSLTPEATAIRYAEVDGALTAQVTMTPLTRDPRVADDPEEGRVIGQPFQVAGVLDKGSVRLPAYVSLAIFVLYTAFHLWGLSRAERRKLSPILN